MVRRLTALVLAFTVAVVPAAAAATAGWSDPVQIDSSGTPGFPFIARDPVVAVQGDGFVAVWSDPRELMAAGRYRLFFAQSKDGLTWTADAEVSLGQGVNQLNPSIASCKDDLVTAWDTDSSDDIWVAGKDGAAAWSDPVRLTDDGNWPLVRFDAECALHALWLENNGPGAGSDVMHATSTDLGTSWDTPRRIGTTNGIHSFEAAPDGSLHAAWPRLDERILYITRDARTDWSREIVPIDGHTAPRVGFARGRVVIGLRDSTSVPTGSTAIMVRGGFGWFGPIPTPLTGNVGFVGAVDGRLTIAGKNNPADDEIVAFVRRGKGWEEFLMDLAPGEGTDDQSVTSNGKVLTAVFVFSDGHTNGSRLSLR